MPVEAHAVPVRMTSTFDSWLAAQGLPEPGEHWPEPFAAWYGGQYPAGRGRQPMERGWTCSGCGRGYAPWKPGCDHCGPRQQAAQADEVVCCGPRGDVMAGCEDAER